MRGNFTPFMNISFQIWDHFFPLLFPEDSGNLKSLDIGLWEVGEKRPLNGVRKCDGPTNRQTHIRTFQLIEIISPEGRFFEKTNKKNICTLYKSVLTECFYLFSFYAQLYPVPCPVTQEVAAAQLGHTLSVKSKPGAFCLWRRYEWIDKVKHYGLMRLGVLQVVVCRGSPQPLKQGSSENDVRSNVYDRSE